MAGRAFIARFVASMIATAAVCLSVGAGAVNAGIYQVWSCSPEAGLSTEAKYAEGSWFSVYMWGMNHCPGGLDFFNFNEQNSNMDWEWNGYLGTQLRSVTLTMQGGDTTDGIEYQLIGARPGEYSMEPFATLPERIPGQADETVSGTAPPGTWRFGIRSLCTQETCSGASQLRVNKIKFRLEDSDAPRLYFSSNPTLNLEPDGATTGAVPWFKPTTFPLSYAQALDDASGVEQAHLRFDSRTSDAWTANQKCEYPTSYLENDPPAFVYSSSAICEQYAIPEAPINLEDLSDGRHKLTMTATDAMGNSAEPFVGWFGIDGNRPGAPTKVHATQTAINGRGWTNKAVYAFYPEAPPEQSSNAAPITDSQGMITRDDVAAAGVPATPNGLPRTFPSEGHFRLDAWYVDAAGNAGHSAPTFVGFDTTPPPKPELEPNGWISDDKLIAGYEQRWQHIDPPASVESKICGFIAKFDTAPINQLSGSPNIDGNTDSALVPPGLPEGNYFSHVSSVSCADNVSATATTPLKIDATDPYVDIDGVNGSSWANGPTTVHLRPRDDLSGIESLEWALDDEPSETSTDEVELNLADGVHRIVTTAKDVAGNFGTTDTTIVQVDSNGPASWVGPAQNGRPNAFEAHAQDLTSGLDSAALQYRRIDEAGSTGERVWRQVGAAYLPTTTSTSAQSFIRELDDSSLADGQYELRVVAVDRAGNIAYGSTIPDGATFVVRVPLRARPAVSLAVADMVRSCSSKSKRGCASKTRCRSGAKCKFTWVRSDRGAGIDRIVDWEDRNALSGNVKGAAGEPISGLSIAVYSTPRGGTRELVRTITSDAKGSFEWRIPKGPSRTFDVISAPTQQLSSASTTAALAVRAGVSIGLSDRSVRSGQRVRITGQIASRGTGIPFGGKKVTVEYWGGERWLPLVSDFTNGSGRYRAVWKVKRTSVAGSGFVRAHVETLPTEPDWPFESGKSDTVRVEISP